MIPLLYENPELCFMGFKDPSFPLPKVIENLFPRRESLLGVPRDRLGAAGHPAREPQAVGRSLAQAVPALQERLGRQRGAHAPAAQHAHRRGLPGGPASPRTSSCGRRPWWGSSPCPTSICEKDIGGYKKVKERLGKEILDVLALKDSSDDEAAMKRIEGLIPRGMIFWGPPGTGKTLFAKAMATALGAAVTIVSGPELKSKWVGESEENLRQVFTRARQAAPAIIVFDELDSFATARGTYQGSGVEHSMVNQLLTEMDGFRKDELVFVVGTTNFVESLDPALMRPGRFEFHLHIPFPTADDRRAILGIYDQKLGLELSPRAMDYAVKRTADLVEGQNSRYSGDHLQALVPRARPRPVAREEGRARSRSTTSRRRSRAGPSGRTSRRRRRRSSPPTRRATRSRRCSARTRRRSIASAFAAISPARWASSATPTPRTATW